MEKAIPEERIVTRDRHLFYCNVCGKYLGDSMEYEDGYYEKIGEAEWSYYVDTAGWFNKRGHYCSSCKAKVEQSIIDAFLKLGFHKGDY